MYIRLFKQLKIVYSLNMSDVCTVLKTSDNGVNNRNQIGKRKKIKITYRNSK